MNTYIIEVKVKWYGKDKFVIRAKNQPEAIAKLQEHYQKTYGWKLSFTTDYRYNLRIESIKTVEGDALAQIQSWSDDLD